MRRRIIVDTETTALEPDYKTGRGTIWELAVIALDDDDHGPVERLWRMKPDAHLADPAALATGHYYERTKNMQDGGSVDDLMEPLDRYGPYWSNPQALASVVARYLSGATLIGAVPSFDAGFLAAFLRTHGEAPAWHYRLRDIGSMAWGYLSACMALGVEGRDAALGLPAIDAGTDDFARALGIDLDRLDRHTALGDCRLVAAMLNVIEGGAP